MICKSPYQTKQYSHKLGQKPKVDMNFTSKDKVLNPENLQSSSGFSLPSVSFPSISALSNDRAYKEQIISPQSNSQQGSAGHLSPRYQYVPVTQIFGQKGDRSKKEKTVFKVLTLKPRRFSTKPLGVSSDHFRFNEKSSKKRRTTTENLNQRINIFLTGKKRYPLKDSHYIQDYRDTSRVDQDIMRIQRIQNIRVYASSETQQKYRTVQSIASRNSKEVISQKSEQLTSRKWRQIVPQSHDIRIKNSIESPSVSYFYDQKKFPAKSKLEYDKNYVNHEPFREYYHVFKDQIDGLDNQRRVSRAQNLSVVGKSKSLGVEAEGKENVLIKVLSETTQGSVVGPEIIEKGAQSLFGQPKLAPVQNYKKPKISEKQKTNSIIKNLLDVKHQSQIPLTMKDVLFQQQTHNKVKIKDIRFKCIKIKDITIAPNPEVYKHLKLLSNSKQTQSKTKSRP